MKKNNFKVKSSTGQILWSKCEHANTWSSRLIGLLNKENLPDAESMLLDPANQVHTFFMRFGIDVLFLDSENKILCIKHLKPWRLSPLIFKSKKILETRFEQTKKLGLKVGDRLEFEPC